MPTTALIGFLPIARGVTFDGGRLEPLDDIRSIISRVALGVHPDGYLYPPPEVHIAHPLGGGAEDHHEVPGSRRQAFLWKPPISHRLTLERDQSQEEFRVQDGAFVLHAIAYLYGYRLQFEGWLFDHRVPYTHPTHHVVHLGDAEKRFLSIAYATWLTWDPRSRLRFTNLLYMHARLPMYEWFWEQYLIEYTVTDALFKHCCDALGVRAASHAERLTAMATELGVWMDADLAEAFVKLRNDLVHEGLWVGASPGHTFDVVALERTQQLRCLNQRLIAAALGFRGRYSSSEWSAWLGGLVPFE